MSPRVAARASRVTLAANAPRPGPRDQTTGRRPRYSRRNNPRTGGAGSRGTSQRVSFPTARMTSSAAAAAAAQVADTSTHTTSHTQLDSDMTAQTRVYQTVTTCGTRSLLLLPSNFRGTHCIRTRTHSCHSLHKQRGDVSCVCVPVPPPPFSTRREQAGGTNEMPGSASRGAPAASSLAPARTAESTHTRRP